VEILKQGQYAPLPVERQVVVIYAGTRGYVDQLQISEIAAYERGLGDFIEKKYPEVFETLRTKKALDDAAEATLKKALEEFASAFGSKSGGKN
jgi:F-type H+-transporting ATPase subunit alpha